MYSDAATVKTPTFCMITLVMITRIIGIGTKIDIGTTNMILVIEIMEVEMD